MYFKNGVNKVFIASILFFAISQPGFASMIVGTTANVLVDSAPSSLLLNTVENNDKVLVFSERQGVILGSDLLVNFTGTGLYEPAITNEAATEIISSGTKLDSYMLNLDSIANETIRWDGSLTFDNKILGIIGSFDPLVATDSLLGAVGTIYETSSPTFGGRGMEGQDFSGIAVRDSVAISADGHTLAFSLGVNTWFDNVRVLVASDPVAVPEPSSWLLLGLGLSLLMVLRRNRGALY